MSLQTEFKKSLKLLDQHVGSIELHLTFARNSNYAPEKHHCLMIAVDRLKYAKNCLWHAELHLAEMQKTGGLK